MTTVLTAGLGLKPQHYDAALACPAAGLWFEVHPENYMVDGGPRLGWLEAIRARHPVSLHGVALSLAADAEPDASHLARLAALAQRIQPELISEHLAWSTWRGAYHPDLLPFPRTNEALARIADNISRTQDVLQRRIAIENPSHYLKIDDHTWNEIDFLTELTCRSGCGLLLDVNNVYVSARNLGFSAEAYIDSFPGDTVMEIHLAGHTPDPNLGDALLVDTHDAPVAPEVWALYERLIARIGARPTLIERDDNLPAFEVLLAERTHADALLMYAAGEGRVMQTSALGRFQDAFAQALFAPEAVTAGHIAALTAQPAFAVYRNTVMKGCIDALQANYPAVLRLVGEEWLRAAAAVHVRDTLPTDPTLLRYGEDFADFLTRFEPAAELPYLPGVARLDRLWTEAHAARDEVALDPSVVASLAPEALAHTVLHPHAATRWMWFEDGPIYTIWSRNRVEALAQGDIDWHPEGALLVRPRDAVEWLALDAAGCAFLDVCAVGGTLAEAAEAALAVQADIDLAQLMSTLLAAGAFGRISITDD